MRKNKTKTQPFRNEILHKRLLKRRTFILGSIQLGVSTLLASKLVHLQLYKSDKYSTMAEDNRINLQLIAPERGFISDRFGVKIAENKHNFQLVIEKTALKHKEEIFSRLQKLQNTKINFEEVLKRQLKRNPHEQNILLKENLTWDEVSRIEFNAPYLQGIIIKNGMLRHYPLNADAAHLIGYVGTASPKEAEGNRLLKMPEVKIGKNGLEKKLEPELRGEAGLRYMEVNARGQYLRELQKKDAVAGKDIKTTISSELQQHAAKLLEGHSGSIVVIDVISGDVLTLCSVPAFDPNRFSIKISDNYWRELNQNEKNPLMNKAITGQYPPGSTFKMLVGLAALKAEIINPNTNFYCPGHYYLGKHRFNCWKPGGHGNMNFRSAISQSCDTFFYNIGRRISVEKIADTCREFGLGEHYDLGLTGEKTGLLPNTEWKRKNYNQSWQAGDTINVSIGQGYVLTTPFQLAVMSSRLATGKKVIPRLIYEENTKAFDNIEIDSQSLQLAQSGMIDVMSDRRGTARESQIKAEGLEMAGKTGTAQVRKIKIRGQKQEDLPWEARHHALFVAYAPIDKPRYALSVVIEHGGGGSSVAAPIARDMMLKVQQLMQDKDKNKNIII